MRIGFLQIIKNNTTAKTYPMIVRKNRNSLWRVETCKRQTVTKYRERQSQKTEIHHRQRHNMHPECISIRNTECSVHFMQQTMRTEVNAVNKRTEWVGKKKVVRGRFSLNYLQKKGRD